MATDTKRESFKKQMENARLRKLIRTDMSKSDYEDEMLSRGYDEKIFISNWTENLANDGYFSY
ncbi:MAG: hypothetical protein IJI66_13895 [Erysipelotrichaceae bacterium]|nr:hypothetical protein [Erysipelotrichaceae bacterium]